MESIKPVFILVGGRSNPGEPNEKEYRVVISKVNHLELHNKSMYVYQWADIEDLKFNYVNFPIIVDYMLCGTRENYYLYSRVSGRKEIEDQEEISNQLIELLMNECILSD